ncbi:hypothetical protein HWN40_02555 [Methanolobus zinderi]|jgi:hypothetical protein|uniref:Uncharacterized protein n=1 Tax=Methanolobus zinderi TaxID=536044 RepID=A0A7D5I406_9EURY|nr:hypothetical protein [Methanolobus zinderi]QLC49223.1 hypothetical protein HWN40_02555 [Methanolobus zinderi]
MQREDIIEQVSCSIKNMKGVGDTLILTEEDRETIRELEKKADEMTLMGLGRGDNKGVKQVLKNDVIFAFTTNMDFEWPEGPNVILMHEGCVVGEDIADEKKLEEYKCCKTNLVIGNIVIYDVGVLKRMDAKKNPLIVVLPPKPCSEVDEVPQVCNATLASPSPPSDEYIKERLGLENIHGTGSFLVGFDFDCSCN